MSELITIEELKNKIDDNPTISIIDAGVDVKEYVPLEIKQFIVDNIVDSCIEEDENGMYTINYFIEDMSTVLCFVGNYTNIDIDSEKDNLKTYNFLKQYGIVDKLLEIEEVAEELWFIESIIRKELKQRISINNSIECSVNKFLSKLIDKVPNEKQFNGFIKKIEKIVKNVSPDATKSIKDFVDNLNKK